MRFKRNRQEEIRLGIAPLIDVVFLLLIFFMVTAHFDVASGVQIRLPKVAQKTFLPKEQKITLVIDPYGKTYLKGQPIDREALRTTLKDLVREEGLLNIILQADKETKHGRVVEIMDLAKTSGVQTILIAARWDAEEKP